MFEVINSVLYWLQRLEVSLSFKALAAQSFTLYYSTTIRVICNRQALGYKCLSSHSKWLTRFNPDGINSHLVGILRYSYYACYDTDVRVKRKAHNTKEYWYWYNYLFLGCSPLVRVHLILFMLSKCFSFRFNLDFNWYNTMFYKINQVIERTHTCVPSRRLSQQVHVLSNNLRLHWPTVWLGDLFPATEWA